MRAILLSGAIALFISLLGTRVAINQFRRLGLGQQIRDDGPTSHHTKMGILQGRHRPLVAEAAKGH